MLSLKFEKYNVILNEICLTFFTYFTKSWKLNNQVQGITVVKTVLIIDFAFKMFGSNLNMW